MNGLLNILKPPGMTSHDVVGYVRKTTGQKKAGHTGTLDPGAAGVLTICLGKATRIIEYLASDKRYRAEITFGVATTTQDAFGEVIRRGTARGLTVVDIKNQLASFIGEIEQVPPMTSAVKYQGKKLYELARKGMQVERKPRAVKIHSIDIIDFMRQDISHPRAILDIRCSAGTYMRTICHDLGERLGCGAYMSFLLRTQVGAFTLEDTITLEQLAAQIADRPDGETVVVPMGQALAHIPLICIEEHDAGAIGQGKRIMLPVAQAGEGLALDNVVRLEGTAGLIAMAKVQSYAKGYYVIQPVKVLA